MLDTICKVLRDPHAYAGSQTQGGKKIAAAAYRMAQPIKVARLRRLCRDMAAGPCRCNSFHIDHSLGYPLIDARSWSLAAAAVAEARKYFQQANLTALTAAMTDRQPFTNVPWVATRESPIVQLATHECFLRPIASYFGTLPIVRTVQLLYSPNNREVDGSSQHYHLDGQDVKSMQVFIYVEDVATDNGPLTLIDATTSAALCRATRYRKAGKHKRLTDEAVERAMPGTVEPRELVAPAGYILFFDGDRCLHFGSRKGTRPRFILHMFLTSAFSFTLKPGDRTELAQLTSDSDPTWRHVVRGAKLA